MDHMRKNLLEKSYDRVINVGFCLTPYQDLSDMVDPNVMIFGTTKDEKIFSLEELMEFFKSQYKQMEGIKPSLERKRISTQISEDQSSALIAEEITLNLASEEINNSLYLRTSCVLQFSADRWRLTHWHSSTPVETENDHWHMQEWKRENEKLQKLVDEQTADLQIKNRELEIEAAVERVRAKTMAMKTQSDLLGVVEMFGDQLNAVGVRFDDVTIIDGPITKTRAWELWSHVPGADEITRKVYIPYIDTPYFTKTAGAVEEYENTGNPIQVKSFTKSEKDEFLDHYFKHAPAIPDEVADLVYANPGSVIVDAFLKEVTVSLVRWDIEPFTEEELEIFDRFAKEFRQAYIRYIDIKKAEAQAHEAKIEASLERVRARSMGMYKSNELIDVVREIGKGIHELGIQLHYSQIYTDYTHDPKTGLNIWLDVEGQDYLEKFHLPYIDHSITLNYYNALNEGLDYFSDRYSKAEKDSFFKLLFKYSDLKRIPQKRKELIFNASGWARFTVILNEASLNFGRYSLDEFTDQEHEIFIRFAKVFGQAYTRFLDLQKAEAQAREAQIEASLERVRSRSLAMHKTDELQDIVRVVAEELKNTGVILDTGGAVICTYFQDSKDVIHWTATEDPTHPSVPYLLPYFKDKLFDEAWVSKNRGDDYFAKVFSYNVKNAFWNYAFEHSDYRQLPDEYKKIILESESHGLAWAWAENSAIMIPSIQGDLPSEEEKKILIRFAKVFEQSFIRFLDLQKAEEQAREAEIQLALERVRAKSLAMHKSEELGDLSLELVKQVQNLGLDTWFCAFNIHDDHPDGSLEWGSNGEAVFPQYRTPKGGIFLEYLEAGQRGEKLYIREIPESECEAHYEYLCSLPGVGEQLLEMKANGIPFPDSQIDHVAFFKYGYILFITFEPAPEAHDTFKRFAHVFEQSYTRFLDLQKAEAQAREAQIETALEKIRSRTMAMQKGDELQEVAVLLYKELIALGVTNFVTCGYVEVNEEIQRQHTWVTSPGGDNMGLFHLPLQGDATFDERYAAWKRQQPIFHQSIAGQVRSDHLEYAITTFNSKEAEEMVRSQFPDPTVFYCFNFPHGYLHTVGGSRLKEEEELLLVRFTKVFAQTYTRFLDLQKAEAQAREAKIETALEKIRSRTMGMQSSEELPEVANLLFQEVQELGIPAWSCGYNILEEDKKTADAWMSSEGTIQDPFKLRLYGEASFDEMGSFTQSDKTMLVQELGGEALQEHYKHMKSFPDLKSTFAKIEENGLSLPTYQINHLCKFSHGFLLFITYEPVPEAHNIFKRFTNVFDQTYTRFLDLKKSEQRAREAEVELSLERVRSQVSAMQESSDLQDMVVTMRNEFTSLGHDAHYFWYMRWLPDQYKKAMTSGDGSKIGMVMTLPRHIHGDIKKVADWEQSDEPILVLDMDTEQAVDYVDKMISLGDFEQLDPQAPTLDDIRHIGGLTFIMARTSQGEIGYSLPGVVPDPPEEAVQTLIRFAGVFDFAYQRFEDLKEAEKQAQLIREERDRLEAALEELHATQDQLIQQEKLASLGQLTAGIAHEIKNPLNFVNNFSELSVELIEEIRDEVRAYRDTPLRDQGVEVILELLKGIETNLTTIHKHGTRADGIVKSMLEHSRGGSGKMEPSNLNALMKEFVNLTFHGMRASKNPINVDIEFELDESIGEVPLITEDFSRVLINLCNNAFDAMREKAIQNEKLNIENYSPKLKVRTSSEDGKVAVEIEDNGAGIPDEMKDKVLQPFFTTKKGTQGTGLGLSITNDIIKAHGGKLLIDTNLNQGSTFTVVL